MRTGTIHRVTGETDVRVALNLDGTGRCQASTGVPFLDHMLHQISSHGLIDLDIQANGDTHIDDHHTNEDVGISIGQALAQALGDRRGIHRFGHFVAPLDEALVQVALDCSGRPHLSYGLVIPAQRARSSSCASTARADRIGSGWYSGRGQHRHGFGLVCSVPGPCPVPACLPGGSGDRLAVGRDVEAAQVADHMVLLLRVERLPA